MSTRPFPNWQKLLVVLAIIAVSYGLLKKLQPANPDAAPEPAITIDAVQASSGHGPMLYGCPVFPADNVWNTPIDKLPKDAHSDAYIQSMGAQKTMHPDFGEDRANGIPYSAVPPNTPPAKVVFDNTEESDAGPYPIPANASQEIGSDGHLELVEPVRCMLYELYDAHPQPDGSWKAGSGIAMDLTSNGLRPNGKTSADAAGLPILPGLVRYDEVAAGEIDHALRFTTPHTQKAHVWPARHDASGSRDPNLPPLGVRLRLRADFDMSSYSRSNRVILTALKRYGMFLADNGGAFYLTGAPDKRWSDDDLHHLNGLKGQDFEVVDESSFEMSPDSGRVDPKALPR